MCQAQAVRSYTDAHKGNKDRMAVLLTACVEALSPHVPAAMPRDPDIREPYCDCSRIDAVATLARECSAAVTRALPVSVPTTAAGVGSTAAAPQKVLAGVVSSTVPEMYRATDLWGELLRAAELLWQPVALPIALASTGAADGSVGGSGRESHGPSPHHNGLVLAVVALAMQVPDVNDRIWLRCVKVSRLHVGCVCVCVRNARCPTCSKLHRCAPRVHRGAWCVG